MVHHSGTVVDQNLTDYAKYVEAIRAYHKSKGWRDIGYHFVITPDGAIHKGRTGRGAHCKGHNDTIGICLLGDFDLQHPTKKQLASLRSITKTYKKHNYWANTRCPGRNVP
jgi:hypothetical protein